MPLKILSENEKDLDPTQWTKRFNSSAETMSYIEKFGKEESAKYKKFITKENVKYGPGERQLLDIYCNGDVSGAPVLLFVHGGYWQGCTKELAAYWLNPFLEKGYCIVMIGYDLCPTVTLSGLIAEVNAGLKYGFRYAKEINSKSISLVGHSAGAHLSISALDKEIAEEPNFDCLKSVFLVAGMYDLHVLLNTPVNEDNALSIDESNVKQVSPMFFDFSYLKGRPIKYYLCAAEYESPIFIEQSENMKNHLSKFELNIEYKFMKDVDHFDIMENFVKDDYELTIALIESLSS